MAPLLPAKPDGAYRVLHTADWHLGKLLGSLSRLEEQARFLQWLEGVVIHDQIDLLLIAGDLFDSATPPQSATRLYYDFLAALHASTRCAVVVIAGNHDSPALLEAPIDLLRVVNTRVAGRLEWSETGEAIPALFPLPSPEAARVVVAALPFLRERDLRTGASGETAQEIEAALCRGIAQRYEEAADAAAPWKAQRLPLIATGHLTALGSRSSESEREIHVGGLGAVGAEAFPEAFDYVALGHLHRPQSVGGRETIRYSGSPIPLSFSEANDRKQVLIIDFPTSGEPVITPVKIPTSRSLIRLSCPQSELQALLSQEPATEGDLTAWVELTVTEADRSADLFSQAREWSKHWSRAEIIRVPTHHRSAEPRLEAELEEGDDLLDDPAAVFARRLDQEQLEPKARAAVELAFQELQDRWSELTTAP